MQSPGLGRGLAHGTCGLEGCQGVGAAVPAAAGPKRNDRRADARRSCDRWVRDSELDRVPHVAQDAADLIAQEDEGNDRDDRDEGEDQRVLREALAFLVTTDRGEQ